MLKKYLVVHGNGSDALNKIVNEHIAQGWVPLGGVSTAVVPPMPMPGDPTKTVMSISMAQAMIKE